MAEKINHEVDVSAINWSARGDGVGEASDIGLAPGVWPTWLIVKGPEGTPCAGLYQRYESRYDQENELQSIRYWRKATGVFITILND